VKTANPNIQIPVDLTNPGQFFACCGLLELADRLWPGAEGWFERETFCLRFDGTLRELLVMLILDAPEQLLFVAGLPVKSIVAPLSLTFDADISDRLVVDFWTKIIVKSGSVQVVAAPPWNMWSGNQKSLPIWLKLRDELRILVAGDDDQKIRPRTDKQLLDLFRQTRPLTGRFGFDSTAAWSALDEGFSPNDQGMSVESSPATELLAAVGLQRCRPVIEDARINYYHWNIRASPALAAALACGGLAGSGPHYRFNIINRGQYSAFGKARIYKGEPANV